MTSHSYVGNKLTNFVYEESKKLPETDVMQICRNYFGKTCEIASSELYFGGF
jgi:hypothetical protein